MRFIKWKKKADKDKIIYKAVNFDEEKLQNEPEASPEKTVIQSESAITPVQTEYSNNSKQEKSTNSFEPVDAIMPDSETPKAEAAAENGTVKELTDDTIVIEAVNPQKESNHRKTPEPEEYSRQASAPGPETYSWQAAAPGTEVHTQNEQFDDNAAYDVPASESEPKIDKLKAFFGNRPITRKYVAVMVTAAVVLNSVLTAGMLAAFAHKDRKGMPDDPRNGRPESEQFFDDNNKADDNKKGSENNNLTPPENSFPDIGQYYGDDDRDSDDYGYYPYYDDDDDMFSPYGGGNGNYQDDNGLSQEQGGQEQTPQGNQLEDPYQQYGQQQGQQNSSGAYIGIVISDDNGVYITQVNGENAEKAGFKAGDKVISFEGTKINTSNDLISEVQKHKSGDEVTVTVERDGQQMDIKTTLQ